MKILLIILSALSIYACDPPGNMQKAQIIVDVRTVEEWEQDGHAECNVNYPLDQFESKIGELKFYKKVILVCRSGNRAEQAKIMLLQAGYTQVENQGAWQNIECKK
jgi:rhodanese-related sulfurtransferase